ncbi:hypothetical protein P9112_004924 [Eukaryota sp. TZLM1-RC]
MTINSRLDELLDTTNTDLEEGSPNIASESEEDETQPEHMNEFYVEVSRVKSLLNNMAESLDELGANFGTTETYYGSIDSKKEEQMLEQQREQVNSLIEEIGNIIGTCKTILKSMEERTDQLVEEENLTCHNQIRRTIHGTLSKQFYDQMRRFQEMQTEHRDNLKQELIRQVSWQENIDLDGSDLAQSLLDGNVSANLSLVQSSLIAGSSMVANDRLQNTLERHQDVVKITESISQLAGLMQDFALLVQAQGEKLERLDSYTAASVRYVIGGNQQLQKAIRSKRRFRKKACCLLCCLTVLLLFFLFPLLSSAAGNA